MRMCEYYGIGYNLITKINVFWTEDCNCYIQLWDCCECDVVVWFGIVVLIWNCNDFGL